MKNREKYKDELEALMIRGMSFGIHKTTGEVIGCSGSLSSCNVCAFRETTKMCMDFRTEWLDEEYDDWADFRGLKKGDLILINNVAGLSPYLFVRIEDDCLVYSRFIDDDGEFQLLLRVKDPRLVTTPDRFAKIWR